MNLEAELKRFESLPDDALIPSRLTAIILGVSEKVVRNHPKLRRIQISEGRYGQRAGDVRKICRGGYSDINVARPLDETAPTVVRAARPRRAAPSFNAQ